MIYLTSSALKYAVNICEELPNYRVGIAMPQPMYFEHIIDIMLAYIKDTKVRVFRNIHNTKIEFANGSFIKFINASAYSRGFAVYLIIVDHDIDEEIVRNVLLPYEKVDYYRLNSKTKKERNEKIMKVAINLNTITDIEKFTSLVQNVDSDVRLTGKDENGNNWNLSAKSLLCSIVVSTRLQKDREHTAHEVDWNTIYCECEEDIYSLIQDYVKI